MVYFLVVESDGFRRGEFDDVSTDDAELIADRPHIHFPQGRENVPGAGAGAVQESTTAVFLFRRASS